MPVSYFWICTWPLDVTRDVPDEWSQDGRAVCPGLQWQDSGAVGQADGTGTTACGPTGGNICVRIRSKWNNLCQKHENGYKLK